MFRTRKEKMYNEITINPFGVEHKVDITGDRRMA
jgi:hypothetical protein